MAPILDAEHISQAISHLASQIQSTAGSSPLNIIGIRSRGDEVAERVCQTLSQNGIQTQLGTLDISLYRDDLAHLHENPKLKGSDIHFPIDKARIILIDDVLFTGRTIRAALDAITDYGRPDSVELGVLIDRGHRELPIQPNFIGKKIETKRLDHVIVKLQKNDGLDAVELVENG